MDIRQEKTLPVEIESQLSQILLRTNHDRQKCEEAEAEALTELIMSEIFGVQQISQMTVAPSYTQNTIIHEVFQDLGWL